MMLTIDCRMRLRIGANVARKLQTRETMRIVMTRSVGNSKLRGTSVKIACCADTDQPTRIPIAICGARPNHAAALPGQGRLFYPQPPSMSPSPGRTPRMAEDAMRKKAS